MKISAFLIDKRKEKSFTQAQVAEMAEISRAYYTQIETEIKRPSPGVAQKIAGILGFDWTIFLLMMVTIRNKMLFDITVWRSNEVIVWQSLRYVK